MRGRHHREFAVSFFAFQDIITAVTGVLVLITLLLALLINTIESSPAASSSAQADSVTAEEIRQLEEQLAALTTRSERFQEINDFAAMHSANDVVQRLSDRQEQLRRLQEEIASTTARVARARAELTIEQGQLAAMAEDLGMTELEQRAADLQDRIERLESSNRVIYNFRDLEGRSVWLIDIHADRIAIAEYGRDDPPQSFIGTEDDEFMTWVRGREAGRTHFVLFVRPGAVGRYDRLRTRIDPLGYSLGVELLGASAQVLDPRTGAAP